MEKYYNISFNIIKKINSIYSYRVLYINYFIYLRINYNLDESKKKLLFNSLNSHEELGSINSTELSDLISINSLMDEEVIVNRFLNKKIIGKFLNFFKKNLPTKYKIDKFLLLIQSFKNYAFYPIILFVKNQQNIDINKMCIYLICYKIGIIISNLYNSFLVNKNFSLKSLLILNNSFLIIPFSLLLLEKYNININQDYLFMINRFCYGLSNSKIIETKYLISYTPKLILINNIKNYFQIKYLFIFFSVFYIILITYIQEKYNFEINLINFINENSKHEFIFICFCLIIMIINIIFFKNIIVKEIIKNYNKTDKILINKSENNESIPTSNIFESTNSTNSCASKENSDDHHSNLSYGKRKLISYKVKRKAKLMDKRFKSYANNENYEGKNLIIEEIDEIIYNQNYCCSYLNKISLGLSFLLIISIINNETLFILISYGNNSSLNFIIISIPYLIGYLSFYFKEGFKKIKSNINLLNSIIIIIFISEILFYAIIIPYLIIFDNKFGIIILLIIIIYSNIIIESLTSYLMSILIPIEKSIHFICKINFGTFIDLLIFYFSVLNFIFIFIISKYFFAEIKFNNKEFIIILGLNVLNILGSVIFFCYFNHKVIYKSLTRIMNKITYEK